MDVIIEKNSSIKEIASKQAQFDRETIFTEKDPHRTAKQNMELYMDYFGINVDL